MTFDISDPAVYAIGAMGLFFVVIWAVTIIRDRYKLAHQSNHNTAAGE